MNNIKIYTNNNKFSELSEDNQRLILEVDKLLSEEQYIFNGSWRNDTSSGGYNSSFKVINSKSDRKNLITIRPMRNFLKIEVYWGFSKSIPLGKKPKMYFNIENDGKVSQRLLKEIRELYNYYF